MFNNSIAIVDDDRDLLNIYSEALNMSGYVVSGFTEPIAAYEHIKENPNKYSLVITDDKMPDMNGLFQYQTLRNKSKTKCNHIE
jgi:DNA-binding response OmpR family regulator